jgi:hypothetical protein
MKNLLSLLFLLSSGIIFSQVTLDYYLDQTHPYDNKIPTPVELLALRQEVTLMREDQFYYLRLPVLKIIKI